MSINEEQISSSVVFIQEKNVPLFVDDISNELVIPKRKYTQPIINPKMVRSITHCYSIRNCNNYLYTYFFFINGTKKKVNILEEYQDCFFIQQLKSTIDIIQEMYLFSYKTLSIPIFFVCGKDIPLKKRRTKKNIKTENNKIQNKSMALIDHLKFDDIVIGDLSPENNKIQYTNIRKVIDAINLPENPFSNFNIKWYQTILHPVCYENGVDVISVKKGIYHCNTLTLYIDESKFVKSIDEQLNLLTGINAAGIKEKRSKVNNKIIEILFNNALVLFYINLSSNAIVTEKNLTTMNLFYLALDLINLILFYKEGFRDISTIDYKTLFRKFQKKLEKVNEIGICKYIYLMRGNVATSYDVNQCRYPADWTLEDKNEWKKANNIVRKTRKAETTKRATKIDDKIIKKVIKLHKKDLSLREIEKKLKNEISITTISKIIKSNK